MQAAQRAACEILSRRFADAATEQFAEEVSERSESQSSQFLVAMREKSCEAGFAVVARRRSQQEAGEIGARLQRSFADMIRRYDEPPHNQPMQRTGAAGIVSSIRKLLRRRLGH
jgi:hypothetical protein